MTTVGEVLRDARSRLPRRTGIPDPAREARWLLAAAWGRQESWLLAHPEEDVPDQVRARFAAWIERRAAGEPAEHLTGECGFWGREFRVSPAVLVPRPETELVIEATLALPLSGTARVLDVGTGSGCLAVTLAAERPRWRVAGVDRSLAALEVARANAARHAPGVRFGCADLTTAVVPPWDLVVANLPYIPSRAMDALPVEVRRDPAAALDGGPDGLDLVRRLLADLPRVLRACGGAVLELGEGQADAVVEAAGAAGLGVARRIRDLAGCDRVLVLEPR